MKSLILLIAILSTTSAMAFMDFPSEYPTQSDWAKAMTERACEVKFSKSATGTIKESSNGSVTYVVYNKQGKVIAAASAASAFIGAKKVCLSVAN